MSIADDDRQPGDDGTARNDARSGRMPAGFMAVPAAEYAAPVLADLDAWGHVSDRDLTERLRTALRDRYDVQREIGRGGMAVVFLAHDVRLDRDVAIKVLRPDGSRLVSPARFAHEIALVAKLQHPHIVALYESGEADDIRYFVMPYVQGETLRDRLRHDRTLPLEATVDIVRTVASALDFAHRLGVVHRDVKPENVLLLPDGQAQLADFGIALALADHVELTDPGTAPGTPRYMPPESARATRVGPQGDVFALAMVAREMLATIHPAGDTGSSRPFTLRPGVPRRVRAVLERGLAADPRARFGSASEFAEALRTAVAPVPAPRWRARVATLAVLGAAAAIGIICEPPPPTRPVSRKLTAHGRVLQVAMTRDGQWLAFVVSRDSSNVVIVRRVDETREDTVFRGPCCLTMEWSPESTELLVTNPRGAFLIPRHGGTPRAIRAASAIPPGVFAHWIPSLPRSVTLHASDANRRSLLRVALDTEDTTRVPFEGAWAIMDVSWAPDGRRFAALLAYRDPLAFVIATVDAAGTVREITRDSGWLGSPRWSGDGRFLYYLHDPYGDASIQRVRVRADGSRRGRPAQLHAQLEALPLNSGFSRFSMASDGSRAVYTRGSRFANLWLAQPRDDPEPPRMVPLTQDTEDRWAPAVSPDGRRIAFVQRVGRQGELYVMPIVGGRAIRITTGARIPEAGRLAWSPEGHHIAFMSVRGGYPLVHTASLVDGFVRTYHLTRVSPASAHLSWAPNRRIAYLNMERSNIHLLDPESAQESPMIPSPPANSFIMGPRFDPKGDRIAFLWTHGQGDGQLWVHDLRDGSLMQLSRGRAAPPIGWSEDGRWVYTGSSTIQRHDIRGGDPAARLMMLPLREGSCTPAGPQRPGGFVCVASDFTSDVWAIEPFDPR